MDTLSRCCAVYISQLIEAVYPQWSGSDKKVIKGIGIVTCVYVNPKTHEYWVIDYRIFDKAHW